MTATPPPGWRCPATDLPADGQVVDVLSAHDRVLHDITYRHPLFWWVRDRFILLDVQIKGWRPSERP